MADEIKAEYKRLQEKKRPKKDDALEVDEFEWIQVEINCPYFCPTAPPEITQLNKELAVNRDTGKKHQGEAPSEKLVRKFKENPFLPIGGRRVEKENMNRNCLTGCGATTFFLVKGLFRFGRKDSEGSQVTLQMFRKVSQSTISQKMMRGRIVAQGFTIMALLTGIMVSVSKML